MVMHEKISLVRYAADAYKKGMYHEALCAYIRLGKEIGEKYFEVNIANCKRELKYHAVVEQDSSPEKSITSGPSEGNPNIVKPRGEKRGITLKCYSLKREGVNQGVEPPSQLKRTVLSKTHLAMLARFHAERGSESFASWLKTVRVATIMDEFTWRSFAPEGDMLQLTPEGWADELQSFQPELLFVESAWRGKDDLWTNSLCKRPKALEGIVHWCREHTVPSIFWNKEDPIHFNTFLPIVDIFDVIFTYDFDCVARYKYFLKHNNVYFLPMAAQPRQFNPIERYERKDAFCFAGSYYVRYPERTKDLDDFIKYFPEYKPVDIYDRQHGKEDQNYAFPEQFTPFIQGGLPYDQIDKAYKGYSVAINLNSIKQAQSLARRVYELLACNTVIVSNFSRGVRTQVGDLVIMSDSGKEIVDRLRRLEVDSDMLPRLRLAGLRKVMGESLYQDRFAYIISKIAGIEPPSLFPQIFVAAYVETPEQAAVVQRMFFSQTYERKELLLISTDDWVLRYVACEETVSVVFAAGWGEKLQSLPPEAWLACMSPDDFYAPSYLTDMALATRFAGTDAVGKGTYYAWLDEGLSIYQDAAAYTYAKSIAAVRGLARAGRLQSSSFVWWKDASTLLPVANALALDPYNYCKSGNHHTANMDIIVSELCDIPNINCGFSVPDMQKIAEVTPAAEEDVTTLPRLWSEKLFKEFGKDNLTNRLKANLLQHPPSMEVSLDDMGALRIISQLGTDEHEYRMGQTSFPLKDLTPEGGPLKLFMKTSPGLNIRLAYFFHDAHGKKISSAVVPSNTNATVAIPSAALFVRFALRVCSAGQGEVHELVFGHHTWLPARIPNPYSVLVITNNYPSYSDIYRNGFVHTRVRAYHQQGLRCGVFVLKEQELFFEEFCGVDVMRGNAAALRKILSQGNVQSVCVHFLNAAMWDVLKDFADFVRINVWIHGAEIHPWHRRLYNVTAPEQMEKFKVQSDIRMSFWEKIFSNVHPNIRFIFVSQQFYREVIEDYTINLPENAWSVIHNPIDTELFSYSEKQIEQRYNILSVRPFASRQYANDLTVECILALARRKDFDKFSIRIIGDGKLFDETVGPLRGMANVSLERTFLKQSDIAMLHRQYGFFLCPSRWDSQGVSRDEAMASGLVPVTNAVAAIPEFVDERCGILAPAEDAAAMAVGIGRLVDNPEEFLAMSREAAARVRRQSAASIIIRSEVNLIMNKLL